MRYVTKRRLTRALATGAAALLASGLTVGTASVLGPVASASPTIMAAAAAADPASADPANADPASNPATTPYYVASPNGAVWGMNGAPDYGSMGGHPLNAPIVGITVTPSSHGYWLVASDGGIFSFGDARFYGSTGALRLDQPIIGMATTPTGRGYWLYASDGGIFSFGDARFYGSTGRHHIPGPVVSMTASPTGHGYWMVGSDGSVYPFGDARGFGSMGGHPLDQPVIGIAARPGGDGYWLLAKDGGVFSFGAATFHGSLGNTALASGVLRIVSSADGRGYWLISHAGEIFPYGSAVGRSMATTGLVFDVETRGDLAVLWALSQLGKPYQWGGTGPDSYDCSGLVMRAWQAAGETIARVAAAQYASGGHVPLSQLQPGDLVFLATHTDDPSTIYHVMMYLGGNKVVEAPYTGQVAVSYTHLTLPTILRV